MTMSDFKRCFTEALAAQGSKDRRVHSDDMKRKRQRRRWKK